MGFLSTRRGFLKTSALVGAAAALPGVTKALATATNAQHVGNLACAPLETVKVGIIGLGMRGPGAVSRLSAIPGVRVTALSDLYEARVNNQVKWLTDHNFAAPKRFFGSTEEWKKLVTDPEVNLVYIATPWQVHVEMVLFAMEHGKHVACEVPMVFTVEDCWKIVNMAEKMRVHCMLLENCCYGATEMFALNLVRNKILGTLVHGEGAYIHDLRAWNFKENSYEGFWRLKWNAQHTGNPYATHGLGPICQYMNVGRTDDQMRVLTAMNSGEFGFSEYVKAHHAEMNDLAEKSEGYKYGMSNEDAIRGPWAQGDMSTAIIKTVAGRTIMVQHDTTSPRPYTRINLISGTKGILKDYPLQIALDPEYQAPHLGWANAKQLDEIYAKYQHPLWRDAGTIAQKMGGHGGMDFLMDLRLCYCLQNGLPLDINVYESCQWSVIAELSEVSAKNDGMPVQVPDFTRGAWKAIQPLGIETVKLDIDMDKAQSAEQLNV
ncbi:MAG: Gfo/Idh/MocA family oxidoreductase [bacterium]|nr:Gfo/Idh/MocA family oxidoreductase [bacterium]